MSEARAGALPACFHCGLPVVEPGRHRVALLGAQRELCCAGCEAVARTIAAAGLERYYETRQPPLDGSASGPLVGGTDRPPGGGRASARTDLTPRGGELRAPLGDALPPAEVYDDPAAQRQFVARRGEHEHEASLILDRIRCAACLWLNEAWLRRLAGVLRVDINYATQRAQVAWDPARLRLSQIIDAVRAIGYDAYPYDPQRHEALERGERRRALWRLFVAGFGATQVMMYAFPAYLDPGGGTLAPETEQLMRWAGLVLTLPVMLVSCGPFFAAAWQDLCRRSVSLDTPIAIGIAAGFAASLWATLSASGEVYFDSITMLVFLLLGARYVEMSARQRVARGLDCLARWMPSFALRLRDPGDAASAERIDAHRLVPGDAVLVPAGERVPADGELVSHTASCDEALLTGESRPVAKTAGATLVGGAVNLEQPLVMRVTRVGADTRAAAIGRLVERAAAAKPRIVAAADRLARHLTLIVLLVAAGAFIWWLDEAPWRALWVAVAVLVATCPCALALAAPIVLTRASAQLLAQGAALTRASALETLERASDVVLDKTGTLTEGRFALARAIPLSDLDEKRCLALAASLEASSCHPIARVFAGAARPARLDSVTNFPGHGVEGKIGARRVRIGAERFCRELAGGPLAERFARPSPLYTPVFLAEEGGWLAKFQLEDPPRAGALELVVALKARGLRVHLLSGDEPSVVQALARHLDIDLATGAATPQDKFAYLERLQAEGRVTAMLGDGLNDAPVLARADVSFAMGGGADAAQSQADVVLPGDRLHAVIVGFAVARAAMRVVRQNFGWALAYNALALPLAAIGWIGPWQAAIGMSASSFIVVLNAMRPLRETRRQRGRLAAPALAGA